MFKPLVSATPPRRQTGDDPPSSSQRCGSTTVLSPGSRCQGSAIDGVWRTYSAFSFTRSAYSGSRTAKYLLEPMCVAITYLGDDVLSVRSGACREKDRRLILYHRTATMHRAGKLERNSAVSPVIVPSMTKSYRARCLPIDRAFRRTASSRAHSACRGPQLPEIRCQPGLCRFVSTTTLSFARLRAYSALGACAHSVNQSNHGNFVS